GFEAQHLMGVLHLAGGVLLLWMARLRTPQAFFWVALFYACVYSPTLTLSNTVVFKNVPQSLDFPEIRVLGTIGWIVAGLSLRLLIKPGEEVNNRPLILAAALSFALGAFSFFLPSAPPVANADAEIPFVKALRMFQDPSAAIFLTASFLMTIALAFCSFSWSWYVVLGMRFMVVNFG